MSGKHNKPDKTLFYTGVGLLTSIVAVGFYGIRKRNIRLSLYLINMRLAAQGSFAGLLACGAGVMLYQRLTGKTEAEEFATTKR